MPVRAAKRPFDANDSLISEHVYFRAMPSNLIVGETGVRESLLPFC
jgi:hypothetical protein